MTMGSHLLFDLPAASVAKEECSIKVGSPWLILIIDDDIDVHPLTELIFRSYTFENRSIRFISGLSGADAKRLIRDFPQTAAILLDVVMETEDAGLEVVRYIREELGNQFVRIILRTGQPGQAPEARVIGEYDINDYLGKASLSQQNLISSVTTSLRSYRDLRTIETTRTGLNKIILGAANFFEYRSLGELASGILMQLSAIINHGDDVTTKNKHSCFAATNKKGQLKIYAAYGELEHCIGRPVDEVVELEVLDLINQTQESKESLFHNHHYIGFFVTRRGFQSLIYLRGSRLLDQIDKDLINVFSVNIASAFENLFLTRETINTQKSVTFTLGEVIEARSGDTGQHVRRVAESSRKLAMLAGLPTESVELLWLASPMHDLGKIGVPDHILNKPGQLTPEERKVVQTHTNIGNAILGKSDQEVIRAGAIIAYQHHERWDGKGYPQGLSGEAIHIFARITAIVDVFDALAHKRSYKDAWPLDRILRLIREGKATQFDPNLSDLFLENVDEFVEIQSCFTDF